MLFLGTRVLARRGAVRLAPWPRCSASGLATLGAVCALGLGSCTNPVPGPVARRAPASRAIMVTTEPPAALDAVPAVVRFLASYPSAEPRPELALFAGALSDYHARRIRDGDLPGTLLERQVPALLWEDEAGQGVLAPSVPLLAGETYTLAALGAGVVATVAVDAGEAAPYFVRVWPPAQTPFAGHAVYCGPRGFVPPARQLELAPVPLVGELSPGVGPESVGAERCFQVHATPSGDWAFALPPPHIDGVAIEPAPLYGGPAPESAPVICSDLEQALGPACLEVADDRLFIRPPAPALLAARASGVDSLHTLQSGGRFVVRGLIPNSVASIDFTLLTAAGAAWSEARQVAMTSPRPRVVINEVLANPSGLEPQQEWVEIVNDGSERVDLTSFTFADGAAVIPLPRVVLEPGQLALIVADEFQTTLPGDVPIPEGCLLVRLPVLGKNGLSNAGESLRLRSSDGLALSQFPALASPKAGVSLARRDTAALDEDASSFALHGAPGASPCSANF